MTCKVPSRLNSIDVLIAANTQRPKLLYSMKTAYIVY